MNKTLKMGGGVTAILAVSLALCESALAINLTIGNTNSDSARDSNDVGQSFRNDPAGTGATILLNDWTFGFDSFPEATLAIGRTLSIYSGIGKNGTALASSTLTSFVAFGGFDSVKWDFVLSNGVSLIDNLDYTVVIEGFSFGLRVSSNNDYANGAFTEGAAPIFGGGVDALFEANFSTPVPFEFEASSGLAMLGAGWLLRKRFQKR